jgi:hypothetical protein
LTSDSKEAKTGCYAIARRTRDAAGRWTQGWKKVYLLSGHQ